MMMMTTVSSKGQFVIPKELRDQLGIEPGTRIAMTVKDGKLILQPSNLRLLEELCGITAGGPSLTDDLLADRRQQRLRSEARLQRLTGETVSRNE